MMNSGTVNMTQASSMTNVNKQNANVQNLSQIIRSVRADISHIKAQMESMPAFPDGKSKQNLIDKSLT